MSPRTSSYTSIHPSASTIDLSSTRHADKQQPHSQSDDLEDNCSETTLASDGLIYKGPRSNIAPHTVNLASTLTWLRFGIVVLMQGVIMVMLLPSTARDSVWGGVGSGGSASTLLQAGNLLIDKTEGGVWTVGKTETGGDVNGLYVPTSHTYTLLATDEETYFPNMSGNINRMEIRHNWDMLMPLGSGSVHIPDYKNHPNLGEPIIDDPIRSGPVFEASWTHALHCLYYHVDNYHQMVSSSSLPNFTSAADLKYGFDEPRNDMHAAHCFEYLRNQILCSADMTLEGQNSAIDAAGDGQAHMCRDRGEAIKWIEDRRVDDIRDVVGPM